MVLARKISRDSKTPTGAAIRAVNMSVVQTLAKRKLPLLENGIQSPFAGGGAE